MRSKLVAGNWKMNTTRDVAQRLAGSVLTGLPESLKGVQVLVCPPFPYLSVVGDVTTGSAVRLGAQNCSPEAPGAFTGEVAVEMLSDLGCRYAILGHSERRHILGESDAFICRKVAAVLKAGLSPILCVGELLEDRKGERTEQVLDSQMAGGLAGLNADQLSDLVIAYEPVWAIGTGLTASPEQAESAHLYLRNWLKNRYNAELADGVQILYGGSVKGSNALSLLSQPDVDGALVGGASLIADDFGQIIRAAVQVSQGAAS